MKNKVVAYIFVSILFIAASCKKDNNGSKYTTPPVIILKGANPLDWPYTVPPTAYVDPGDTAYDAIDGNLTGSVIVTGSVNVALQGTYTLNFNVKDKGGLSAVQKTRTVYVVPF